MTTVLSPGHRLRETNAEVRSIEGIPTGITAFIGVTERGPIGVPTVFPQAFFWPWPHASSARSASCRMRNSTEL